MAKNLLLLDDSPLIHRVVELTFEGQDFDVHFVDDADEALSLARTLHPDIVLASTELKGADSLEFCRRLRQEADLARIPLVLLTSALGSVKEEDVRETGAAGVLAKPFEPERLQSEVDRALAAGAPSLEASGSGAAPEEAEEEAIPLEEGLETAAFEEAGEEEPASLPEGTFDQPEEDLQDAETLLDDLESAASPVEPTGELPAGPDDAPSQEVELFAEEELENLFGDELAEDIEVPGAEDLAEGEERFPAGVDENWLAAVDEEAPGPPAAPAGRGGPPAREEEADFEAVSDALSEEQIQAAEAELASLQAELAHELQDAGEADFAKELEAAGKEYESLARSGASGDEEGEIDLVALAEEAGFGTAPVPAPSRQASRDLSEDVDLEAELAAAGVTESPPEREPGEDYTLDETYEVGFQLPEDEKTGGGGESAEASALDPALGKSLERSVEALVPTLMQHIESLVVQQLPDLVEKIVLREIEKIKRGE